MRYAEIADLTFPQVFQLMQKLDAVYKEQRRAAESGRINQTLRQLRYGR